MAITTLLRDFKQVEYGSGRHRSGASRREFDSSDEDVDSFIVPDSEGEEEPQPNVASASSPQRSSRAQVWVSNVHSYSELNVIGSRKNDLRDDRYFWRVMKSQATKMIPALKLQCHPNHHHHLVNHALVQ